MTDYLGIGVSGFKDLFQYLTNRSKTKDVVKNNVLREIRDNMKLLEHRDKEGVNIPALINNLSNVAIEAAYSDNFNFNKLAPKKLMTEELLLSKKRQKDYVGWDVEKFIYSIEGKIKDLKNIPNLYPDIIAAPVNLTLRFDNLFYQLVLLAIFIRQAE